MEQVRLHGAPAADPPPAGFEARYRALVDATAGIVWTTGPDGAVADIPQWRVLTGQTVEQVRGAGWLDALHPDDREATRIAWLEAVRCLQNYDIEYRLRDRNGHYRWYNARGIPVFDNAGQIAEWVGVCIDIHERKTFERRMRRFMDEVPIGVMTVRDGTIVEANDAYLDIIGVDRTALGRGEVTVLSENLPEYYEATFRSLDELARTGRTGPYRKAFRRQDGRIVPVLIGAARLDENESEWVAFVVDLTAQARAEAELRESEMRLQVAIAAARMGTWWLDLESGRSGYSETLAEMLGLPPGERELTREQRRAFMHPDDRPRVVDAMARTIAGEGPYRLEFRIVRRDGEVRWVASAGDLMRHSDRSDRIVGVVRDITERRSAEERQALVTAELDHRVRNLFAVTQALVTLTGRSATSVPDLTAALAGRIAAVARVHTQLTRGEVRGASLVGILRDELEIYGDSVEARGERDCILSPKQGQDLSLAVHELATNAAKYGALSVPGGRVTLSWTVDVVDKAQRLRMEWMESGGPPVTAPTRQGFGTRLINRTLGAGGGTVALDFAPTGVRWRIDVPLSPVTPGERGRAAPSAVAAQTRRSGMAAMQGRRVLVVEDDPLLGLDLKTALGDAGFEVLGPARTLAEAQRLAETGDLSFAVLDVNLDGKPVFPVAELLAARGVPFLFVTGYDIAAIAPEALRQWPVLRKPVDAAVVVGRVKSLLR
ncbi:MAG: PAS domain S-box protein [Alphaproteobacteria bacterium]